MAARSIVSDLGVNLKARSTNSLATGIFHATMEQYYYETYERVAYHN
jgi:hypothetical protein